MGPQIGAAGQAGAAAGPSVQPARLSDPAACAVRALRTLPRVTPTLAASGALLGAGRDKLAPCARPSPSPPQAQYRRGMAIISLICNVQRTSTILERTFRVLNREDVTVQVRQCSSRPCLPQADAVL